MKKNKVLFILHLPPPVHGSSMVGQYIKNSTAINSSFISSYINLCTSKTIDEIGKNPIVKIGRYLKIILKVLTALISFRPKIVYMAIAAKGIAFYKDFFVAFIVKLFNAKLVLHYHNKGVKLYQNKILDNILYLFLFNNSKVILLSERLYDDVKKYVKKENVFICPNGIPNKEFEKVRSPKPNTPPKLLFLSNLIKSKGVFILLDALKILKEKGVEFYCNLVGGEGDISCKELNERLHFLNIEDQVFYLGKKYNEDKFNIFQSSDIFVFPTFYHNECFPLVLLEAMQFNLPIISTNEGGISDIVKNGETGLIVENKNPHQLAEKISWLIDNPQKASLMGKKGQDCFIKNYTITVFENRLINILNN